MSPDVCKYEEGEGKRKWSGAYGKLHCRASQEVTEGLIPSIRIDVLIVCFFGFPLCLWDYTPSRFFLFFFGNLCVLYSSAFCFHWHRAHGSARPRWLARGYARAYFCALILPYIPMRVFVFSLVFLFYLVSFLFLRMWFVRRFSSFEVSQFS